MLEDPGMRELHNDIVVSYEDRCAARQRLKDIPGSEVLFALERARRPGEGEEPLQEP